MTALQSSPPSQEAAAARAAETLRRRAEKRTRLLGEGNLPRVLVTMAIPGIIGMTANAVYNITDSIFIGQLGTAQIGAVAVVFPLFTLAGALGLTFGVGAASYISRSLGAGNTDEANRTLSFAIAGTVLTGIAFMIAAGVFMDPLLRALGATDTILPYARDYGRVFVYGSIGLMLKMCLSHVIRAEGAAVYSMVGIIVGAVLNIILDPIFIFVFDLGIAGAGYATAISQWTGALVLATYYLRRKAFLSPSFAWLAPSMRIAREVIGIGSPLFFRLLLESTAVAIMNTAAQPFGDAAVGAVGVVLRVLLFGSFPVYGFGQGYSPVAGYNYGAGNYKRLFRAVKLGHLWTSAFVLAYTAVVVGFAPQVMRIFSSDPEVISLGAMGLRIIHSVFPLFGLQMMALFTCQALGKARMAFFLGIARQGVFLIPLVLILSQVLGFQGVLAAQAVSDVLTATVGVAFSGLVLRQIHGFRRERAQGIAETRAS
ncbi:MAG: MATE family efflux transporter [Spirochaetales bacterium]